MNKEKHSEGILGERTVQSFFNAKIGSIVSFPNAKTKSNAQVADLLVWLNWKAILVEVKTRVSSKVALEQWVKERIFDAVEQIKNGYSRCTNGEEIYVHNDYYHIRFDSAGVSFYIGLIVLKYEGKSNVLPSIGVPDIYSHPLSIHVLSYDDLVQLNKEIDSFSDLWYYLKDRFKYITKHDIPLNVEKEVIGYYKLHKNKFPDCHVDFKNSNFWGEYQRIMKDSIRRRNAHNEYSDFIDALEELFNDKRKLHGNLPLGLHFAWELGAMGRRERAIVGERIDGAKQRFEQGGNRRYFSFQNPSTKNWLVFLFSNADPYKVRCETKRLTNLKLVKELHFRDFEFAAYGFGFRVSRTYPIRLEELTSAIVISSNEVRTYSEQDLKDAIEEWGDESAKQLIN